MKESKKEIANKIKLLKLQRMDLLTNSDDRYDSEVLKQEAKILREIEKLAIELDN